MSAQGRDPRWVGAAVKKRARREPLSVERIVDAAFKVLASEGYDAVTMRRVAQELGTGQASLYAHVENKAELDALLIDEMSHSVKVPAPEPARWQEQIKQVLRDMRAAMNAHHGVARAILGVIPMTEGPMAAGEAMLAILLAGGINAQIAAWACDLLPLYASAIAFEDSIRRDKGAIPMTVEDEAEHRAMVRQYFESLPAERFPLMSSMAPLLARGSGDERFEFGLSVLVAGLAAMSSSCQDDPSPSQ